MLGYLLLGLVISEGAVLDEGSSIQLVVLIHREILNGLWHANVHLLALSCLPVKNKPHGVSLSQGQNPNTSVKQKMN